MYQSSDGVVNRNCEEQITTLREPRVGHRRTCGLRTVVYNYSMIETPEQQQNVDRIMDAHRRGLRDKHQTVEFLRTLFATLKPEDQREVCEQVGYLLRTQPLGITATVRGVAVNVVGVALLALARFGPTEHLSEFVFSRIKLDDAKEMEAWARAVSPDLRYCLYEQGDRLKNNALGQRREWIAKPGPTNKRLT